MKEHRRSTRDTHEINQEEHKKKLQNIMKRIHIVDKNLEIIKNT